MSKVTLSYFSSLGWWNQAFAHSLKNITSSVSWLGKSRIYLLLMSEYHSQVWSNSRTKKDILCDHEWWYIFHRRISSKRRSGVMTNMGNDKPSVTNENKTSNMKLHFCCLVFKKSIINNYCLPDMYIIDPTRINSKFLFSFFLMLTSFTWYYFPKWHFHWWTTPNALYNYHVFRFSTVLFNCKIIPFEAGIFDILTIVGSI